MRLLKILIIYFLLGAITGLVFLSLDETNCPKTIPVALFLLYIVICVYVITVSNKRKVFYCLLFLNLFQLFAIKVKGLIFIFSAGVSVFHFFKLPSFAPQSINFSISYYGFSHYNEPNSLFGINFMALIFALLLIANKKKIYG